jgi:hypothetical protein
LVRDRSAAVMIAAQNSRYTMPLAVDPNAVDMFGYSGGSFPAQALQPRAGDGSLRGIPIDVVENEGVPLLNYL